MTGDKKRISNKISRKLLERQLRQMPKAEPALELKTSILSNITGQAQQAAQKWRISWWYEAIGFTAATVMVVLAVTFLTRFYSSTSPSVIITDLNDRYVRHVLVDQNNAAVNDINLLNLSIRR